jgi:hypothetical protein
MSCDKLLLAHRLKTSSPTKGGYIFGLQMYVLRMMYLWAGTE